MPKKTAAAKELPQFDLRAAREARGLTQVEVAELLCTTQGTVARWEADGSLPALERKYWSLHWKHTKAPKVKQSKRRARGDASTLAH